MAPFLRGTDWLPEKVQIAAYIVGTIVVIILIFIAVLRFVPSESELYSFLFPIFASWRSQQQEQKLADERQRLSEAFNQAAARRQKDLEQRRIEAQHNAPKYMKRSFGDVDVETERARQIADRAATSRVRMQERTKSPMGQGGTP